MLYLLFGSKQILFHWECGQKVITSKLEALITSNIYENSHICTTYQAIIAYKQDDMENSIQGDPQFKYYIK